MKKIILLILISISSVSLFAQKTWIAGGGSGSGNWSVAANWSGGTVPTSSDSVVISSALTNGNAVITIDANATCGALYLIGGGSGVTGPLLQFGSTAGAISLTVFGGISISGGAGTAPNTRPKLTSNANNLATLILNGYNGVNYFTSSSNTSANNHTGFNMNEGNVQIIGTGSATITASAGLRFGNLQIGDGTNVKTVNFTQTTTSTLTITGLTVKTGSTFNIGNTTGTTVSPNIGSNNVTNVSNWINGLSIESGASLNVLSPLTANTATFNIFGGNIINNGTLNLSNTNRKIIINFGNLTNTGRVRTIGGNNPITFNKLILNDSSSTINLNNEINVTDSLILNRGIIVGTTSNRLNLGSACLIGGGSNLSYVNGPVSNSWDMSTLTKIFPLGKGNIYRPLVVNFTTPNSPILTAELFNANPGGTFSGGTLSQNFYYQTQLLSGTATSAGTAQINFSAITDGVQNIANIGVGQSLTVNGNYTNLGNSLNTASSVTSNNSFNPASGLFLALLSTGGNILPVKFTSFNATINNKQTNLTWTTSSEINNKGFDIERSLDGVNFETIGFVKGNANSNRVNKYSFIDANHASAFYRLKQIDFDGKFDYSNIIAVQGNDLLIDITPNPFNNVIDINSNGHLVNVEVLDITGKIVITETINGNKTTLNTASLNNGVYFVRINNGESVITRRLIKN